MKIAQVFRGTVPPQGYGGIERMVFWLSRALVEKGHDVCVIALRGGPDLAAAGIEFRVHPQSPEALPRNWNDCDVIHFHQTFSADVQLDRPYLITEHGNHRSRRPVQPNTVFLSRSHAENHGARYFVANGLPLKEYPFHADKQDSLLFMAKLGWRKKNAKTAINLALDTDLPIEICGGDVWQEQKIRGFWRQRAQRGKRRDLLRSRGNVDGEQKLRLLQSSGLLFYAVNWQEPFALAPHEAMATGTPVLCTPNGALRDYIRDGENGYLVSSYAQALQAVRRHFTLSERQRQVMYQQCQDTAYSINDCADQYLQAYQTVIDKGHLYPPEQAAQFRYAPRKTVKVRKWFA